jgi:hypothetical protein
LRNVRVCLALGIYVEGAKEARVHRVLGAGLAKRLVDFTDKGLRLFKKVR